MPPKAAVKATVKPSGIADKFAALGLHRDIDFALHAPLRYEDLSEITAIADAPIGRPVQIQGEITDVQVMYRPRRQLVAQLRETAEHGDEDSAGSPKTTTLRFLNFYPSQIAQLQGRPTVRAYGELRDGFFGLEMVHPRISKVKNANTMGESGLADLPETLTPVYPTTASLAQGVLRKRIAKALSTADLAEVLPTLWQTRLKLPTLAQALRTLHNPAATEPIAMLQNRTHPAWQRLKFEELLAQQISLQHAHAERAKRKAHGLGGRNKVDSSNATENLGLVNAFQASLPWLLTAAQQRVWGEIQTDLQKNVPMNRLLQGDVGSGKTVVAALACLLAIENGLQAVLMAPTEILAEQHYQRLKMWLAPLGVRVVWLSGSLPKKAKEIATAEIASGAAQLAIGTHALIQDTVQFDRLGVVVVDEQHRFGVGQRMVLREKGNNKGSQHGTTSIEPHVLMMSATPIPRTLAMTYFADLDVSVIDELPPGRSPIKTTVLTQSRRPELIARVAAWLADGKQAYWVCPLIDESETLQMQTATETFALLQTELATSLPATSLPAAPLPAASLPADIANKVRVGIVHGQMKSADKAATMAAFAANELQLLVATTVIEVGVDVPNASLMVIENAERFGLAQLHQLRGRVGRGSVQSVCVLLYGEKMGAVGKARLGVMRDTQDGFIIAQKDLELRGPGEFLGARQSGMALLRFADLEADEAWIKSAQACAADMQMPEHTAALMRLQNRWLFGREAYLGV